MEQINVNLIPSGLPPVCHASQYDKGRVIKCNLFEGNTPYLIAEGDDITLNARKPDGTIIEGLSPLAIQTGVSYVYITTTEQLCACVGDTLCELRIENSADIGTLNFILRVEADVLADGIPSQSVIKDLNQMVEDAVEDLGVAIIDDTTISADKTWSSDKIDSLAYDFLIEYDSVTEEFNAGANEILHNLGKGYNIQFKTDATADDFIYILSSIYNYGGDDITLFFDKLIITDNGTGNKPSSILSQAVIVVDAAAETVAFAGFLEQDEIQSTNDSHVTQFNTWSAKKTAETIKAAKYSILPTDTAQGAVANFPDGADDVPIKSLIANIDYKDTTGFSAVNVTRAGANLCGGDFLLRNLQNYLPTGTTDTTNKTFTFSAYLTPASGLTLTTGVKFKENTLYTIILSVSKSNTNTATNLRVYYTDDTYANITLSGTIEANTKYTKVQTTDPEKTIRAITKLNASGTTTLYYDEFGVFEGTYTEQDFEAYNGTSVGIPLGQTIYGGSVDVTNGTVTSTKAQDGSDLPDPVVTQISPTELSTLYGTNNIWADTGDVTVDYRADVQKYIDKKIAEALNP